MMDAILLVLGIIVVVEVGFQAVNWIYKRMLNIPIPGSVETEEEE